MQYLQLTTKSRTGKQSDVRLLGKGTLTASTGFNTPSNTVSVEVSHGNKPMTRVFHESPFVRIDFEDGYTWVGSFSDLRHELQLANERRATL